MNVWKHVRDMLGARTTFLPRHWRAEEDVAAERVDHAVRKAEQALARSQQIERERLFREVDRVERVIRGKKWTT
jgi:hypothetical protein